MLQKHNGVPSESLPSDPVPQFEQGVNGPTAPAPEQKPELPKKSLPLTIFFAVDTLLAAVLVIAGITAQILWTAVYHPLAEISARALIAMVFCAMLSFFFKRLSWQKIFAEKCYPWIEEILRFIRIALSGSLFCFLCLIVLWVPLGFHVLQTPEETIVSSEYILYYRPFAYRLVTVKDQTFSKIETVPIHAEDREGESIWRISGRMDFVEENYLKAEELVRRFQTARGLTVAARKIIEAPAHRTFLKHSELFQKPERKFHTIVLELSKEEEQALAALGYRPPANLAVHYVRARILPASGPP